jgi:ribosomal protein S18 acetylase RimI-like enzyme
MIHIRRYQAGDRELLRGLVLELHEALRPLNVDLAPGETILDAYFAHLLQMQDTADGALFVAEQDARLVGYICLFGRVPPPDPDEIDQPHSYIADLYVQPDVRRQHVGERLLKEAEEHAQRLGVHKIELEVLADNREAIRFYRRQGYTDHIIIMTKRFC